MARQVQTVLVSMLMHVVALFIIVVIPLLAMDGPPGVPGLPRYFPGEIKSPEVPAAPQPSRPQPLTTVEVPGPPTEAPTQITPESPERAPVIANMPSADGAIGVLGTGNRAAADSMNVAPPAPTSSDPVRPGGLVKAPTRITNTPPVYPAVAIAARISGTVIIEAAFLRSPRALQRTTALLGSRTVRVIWQGLLQPTGRFRRRSLSLV